MMEGSPDPLLVSFWQRLPLTLDKVLLLDYDGTLAPFQINREEAVPYDGVREILDKILAETNTRVIIVSGRMIDDLLPLLGLNSIPEIWGSHGFERLLPDGSIEKKLLSDTCSNGLETAYSWLIKEGHEAHCEKKPSSVAFHFRGLQEEIQKELTQKVKFAWEPIAHDGNLEIHSFDGGLELRVPDVNKGEVVIRILTESDDQAILAYLGDDLTDEDAFKALKGKGLSFLVRKEFRETLADCWLVPPNGLLDFLNNWYRLARP
jgi:trehalose-phosphatase